MMSLIPVPKSQYHELKSMYFDYIHELLPYEHNGREGVSDEQSWRFQIHRGIHHLWIVEDGKHVGFLFHGLAQLPSGQEYQEIIQFYIIPSERGKGFGKKAVNLFLLAMQTNRCDRIMYLVLRKNPALGFWDKVLEKYPQIAETSVQPDNEDEVWFFRQI